MAETIKINGFETTCNATANSFGGTRVIRLINTGSTPVLITQANSTANTGNFTLLANSSVIVVKGPTDSLVSANNTTILAVPTGFFILMKFLTETLENTIKVIEEGANPPRRFIEGVFMQAGIPNKNNRIYPVDVLRNEVNRCIKENISKNRFYGELGHPSGPNINGDRIAIHIKELSQDGNNFKGKAMIASTPMGSIVNGLLQDGASLGVSSRALGSLKTIKTEASEGKELQEVQDDLKLLAIDVVMDPSAPDAYVNAVNENREWVYDKVHGMWMEQVVERHKKTIKTTKKLNEQQKWTMIEQFIKTFNI